MKITSTSQLGWGFSLKSTQKIDRPDYIGTVFELLETRDGILFKDEKWFLNEQEIQSVEGFVESVAISFLENLADEEVSELEIELK